MGVAKSLIYGTMQQVKQMVSLLENHVQPPPDGMSYVVLLVEMPESIAYAVTCSYSSFGIVECCKPHTAARETAIKNLLEEYSGKLINLVKQELDNN